MIIREYQEEDKEQVMELIAQLQDIEAAIYPGMKPGHEMAERDLEWLQDECSKKEGKIFIAEVDDVVTGLICVWTDQQPTDIMYYQPFDKYTLVAEFIVSEKYRNQGIGKALMEKVEEYTKSLNLSKIKLNVSFKNDLARKVYQNLGFSENEIVLEKKI